MLYQHFPINYRENVSFVDKLPSKHPWKFPRQKELAHGCPVEAAAIEPSPKSRALSSLSHQNGHNISLNAINWVNDSMIIISILRQTHMFEKSWATSLCPTPELLFWQNTLIKRIQVEAEKGRTRISHMLRLIDGWESEVKGGQQWDAMGIAWYSGQVTWLLRRLNDFTKYIKAPRMANIHPLVIRSWRNFTAGAWGIGSGALVVWNQNWCPRGLWHVGRDDMSTRTPGQWQWHGFPFPSAGGTIFFSLPNFLCTEFSHTTFDHIYHPLVSIYWRTKNKHHIFQVTQFRIRPPYPSKCIHLMVLMLRALAADLWAPGPWEFRSQRLKEPQWDWETWVLHG